jgi:hypothetical protein
MKMEVTKINGKHYIKDMGKYFAIRNATKIVDDANSFCEKNPDCAVIQEIDGLIIIAEIKDTILNPLSSLTNEQLEQKRTEIKESLNYPYTSVKFSDLGGILERSVLISISLDKKEDWQNGYIENSRYCRFDYSPNDNKLEQFTCTLEKKFRLSRPKDLKEAISKINKYLTQF